MPKFLLRRFASEPPKSRKKPARLWVRDFARKTTFPSNVDEVASRIGYYDLPQLGAAALALEKEFLGDIETRGAAAIEALLENDSLADVDEKLRAPIALLIVTLTVRGPRIRSMLEEFPAALRQTVSRLAPTESSQREFIDEHPDLTEDQLRVMHAGQIVSLAPLYRALLDRRWNAITPPEGKLFSISDNPILVDNAADQPSRLDRFGLLSPGVEHYFVFAPTLGLLISERSSKRQHENAVLELRNTAWKQYEWLLVTQAREQVYAPTREQLEELPDTWKAGPVLHTGSAVVEPR